MYAVITVFFFGAGIACALQAAHLEPFKSHGLGEKMYQPCAAAAVILIFVLSLSVGKVIYCIAENYFKNDHRLHSLRILRIRMYKQCKSCHLSPFISRSPGTVGGPDMIEA